jgi:hypothetical protein
VLVSQNPASILEAGSSEEDAEASATASSWVSGLMKNDPDSADEVYSLSDLVDGQVRDAARRTLGPSVSSSRLYSLLFSPKSSGCCFQPTYVPETLRTSVVHGMELKNFRGRRNGLL